MLLGNYQAKINYKGRTAVPSRYRRELTKNVVVGQWYENCLVIISQQQWQKLLKGIEEKPFITAPSRDTDRFLVGGAFEIELDSQGRFIIPTEMLKFSKIEDKVKIIGAGDHFEIWNKDIWEEYRAEIS